MSEKTVLVIGRENSGKSALAEELAMETGDVLRYYLATMKICDAEGQKRVRRHRAQREGKGFVTVERERSVTGVLKELVNPAQSTVLLECVANLVGNEMYADPERLGRILSEPLYQEIFADEVANDIRLLAESVRHMIIVTNQYAPDHPEYDDETRNYVHVLKLVNERICTFADEIIDLRGGSER